MSIHIGEKVKARAKELRIGPTELASLVNTSKQNIYGIYKRKTIDVELLKKLSLVLKCDFFDHYYDKQWIKTFNEGQQAYHRTAVKSTVVEQNELTVLKKELQELKEKYELLEKLYKLTEEKITAKKKK